MNKKDSNIIKKIIVVVVVCLMLIGVPFIIEYILYDTTHIPFNIPIRFTREVWFGFLASYLGAVGTVLLGVIALYQNKRYKDLSDESEKHFLDLQAEIKELSKKNVELIEINTKIEKAKYYPILVEQKHYYWNMKIDELDTTNAFQITIKKDYDFYSSDRLLNEIFDKYNTFVYVLRNEGEKVVRNFTCKNVKMNGKHGMGFWMYYPCDIEPGELAYIVYASKLNLYESIEKNILNTMEFCYTMENVIGEHFEMEVMAEFYNVEGISTVIHHGGIVKK